MQARFKRFTALILSVLMVLTCMPLSAMAEDAAIPAEDISVEVIPEDAEAVPEQEAATVMDAEASEPEGDPVSETVQETEVLANQAPAEETPSAPETVPETETPQEEVPQEEPDAQSEETQPAEATEEPMPVEEIPVEEPAAEAPAETEQEAEKPAPDDRHPLQAAIDTYGHIYVATVRQTDVFGNAKLDADTLVFSTTNDVFLLLATKFTDEKNVKVWFMDSDGNVVSGFVSVKNLDEKYLLDEDIKDVSFLPAAQGETAIGMMSLFLVNGSYPAAETDAQIVEEPVDTSPEEEEPVSTETEEPVETDPSETELPAESTEDEPLTETDPTEQPASEEEASADVSQETVQEEPVADPETTENPEESTEPQEAPSTEADPLEGVSENPNEPAYEAAGSYIAVTTQTRVFAGMDVSNEKDHALGEYRGFSMSVMYNPMSQMYQLTLKGAMSHQVELGSDPRGNITRIDNALAGIPRHMQNVENKLNDLNQQMATAKAELGKPFPQEEELKTKSARLVELDAKLNLDRPAAQPGKKKPEQER